MRPIPPKIRKALANDPDMKRCIICGESKHIEWHHPLVYAGKQVNELWSFVALCTYHHRGAGFTQEVREKCQLVVLLKANDFDLKKYPKSNWEQLKNYLKNKYGGWYNRDGTVTPLA